MWKSFCGQVNAFHKRFKHFARIRALQGNDSILLGRAGQPHIKVGPFGLEIILHHIQHACRAASCRGQVETIRRQPC